MAIRALYLLSAVLLFACSGQSQDPVLAKVNGEAIRNSDVDAAWSRTVASKEAMPASDTLRDQLLKSLVASRVMAQKAEALMSDAEKAELDHQVTAWREEQLVKRYLASQVVPTPVSNDKVEEYYHSHPELFGGGDRYQFDMLKVIYRNDTALRDKALDALGKAAAEKDWQGYAALHNQQGLVVIHQHAMADAGFADKLLLARLKTLKAGDVSALSTAQGEVTVLRLNSLETVAPRPLIEVRDDIRQRLAPANLREAVRQTMDIALKDADIEYLPQQKD